MSKTTADDVRRGLDELTDAFWALAAVERAAASGLLGRLADGEVLTPSTDAGSHQAADGGLLDVLCALGMVQRRGSGYEAAPGLAESTGQMWWPGLANELRSHFLQAAELVGVTGRDSTPGWAPADPAIMQAQGLASAAAVTGIATFGMTLLDGLAERFDRPEASFLDIGVGVGGIAVAAAQRWPTLHVVGIDVHRPALQLAATRVAAAGVGGQVELRHQDVADLEDQGGFDLAWLPAMFIPAARLDQGLRRVFAALRPGGWLIFGIGRTEGEGLPAALTRWRTRLWGSEPLTTDAAVTRLTSAGFAPVLDPQAPPGAPLLIFARRPGE